MGIWSRVLKSIKRGRKRRSVSIPRFEPLEGRLLLNAEISGLVWNDINGNGLRDAGEPSIPGWTVYLNTGQSTLTDANGTYQFQDLASGTYKVYQSIIPGFSQTYPTQTGLLNQQHVWAGTTEGTTGSLADAAVVKTDPDGNIYVAGTFQGTVNLAPGVLPNPTTSAGSSDVFITKLSKDGSHIWTDVIAGTHQMFGEGVTDMIIAPSGKIYLVGEFGSNTDFDPGPGSQVHSPVAYTDAYLLLLNPDGSFDSVMTFGGDRRVSILGMDLDPDGNIYMVGSFSGSVDFDPGPGTDVRTAAPGTAAGFLTKINSDGSYAWTKAMAGDYYCRPVSVKADERGNVYVSGLFWGTVDFDPGPGKNLITYSGDWDIFLSRFSSSGEYLGTQTMGGSDWDMVYQMQMDRAGNLYLVGLFSGYADLDPTAGSKHYFTHNHVGAGFVTKLNADGTYAWSQVIASSDLRWAATGISLDLAGNAYVVGERMALPENASRDPYSDLFISKLGPNGTILWTQVITDIVPTQSDVYTPWQWRVGTMPDGQLFVCGRFSRTVDLDTGSGTDIRTPGGTYDAFLIKQVPVSYSHTVTVADGQVLTDINFGNQLTGPLQNLPPIVTSFQVTDSTANAGYARSRTVAVNIEATDIAGSVQAWMITETPGQPDPADAAWQATKPTTYTITSPGDGAKTIYAWVKDDQGAVSELTSISRAQIVLDTAAPTVGVSPLTTNDPTPQLNGTVDDPQASIQVTVDGRTYTATNNADGTWTLADDTISPALKSATYNVIVTARDNAGNTGQALGQLVVNIEPPTALLGVSDLTVPATGHLFSVRYISSIGIDPASLDSADILVTGPDGYSRNAQFVGYEQVPGSGDIVATYTVPAPNGIIWSEADNGTYQIYMQSLRVRDKDQPCHYVPAGKLGEFLVQVQDIVPVMTISDAAVVEGDQGTSQLQFTISLSNPTARVVTVDYQTVQGSALEGSDFVAAQGQVTFQPGQTSQGITVDVVGDNRYEPDEVFYVQLSNPQNADIQDGQAVATILNDDPAPMPPAEYFDGRLGDYFDLSNKAIWFTPDGSGAFYVTQVTTLVGSLPTDPTGGTLLDLADNDSRLVQLTDGKLIRLFGQQFNGVYIGTNGYLTFTGPDTDKTESLADHFAQLRVSGLFIDLVAGSDSRITYKQLSDRFVVTWWRMWQPGMSTSVNNVRNTFQIEMYYDGRIQIAWLSVYSAKAVVGLSDGNGLRQDFTETDLSASDPVPAISIVDASILEGDDGNTVMEFTVQLSSPVGLDVEVEYTTLDATAKAGEDYNAVSGRLTIPAGQTTAVIQVPISGDTTYEYDEYFLLRLSNPVYAVIDDGQATGTIINDDPVVPPVVTNFTAPSLTNSRQINVSIDAYDPDGTVVAWAITESPTPPEVDSAAWQSWQSASGSVSTMYTITSEGDGQKTLYAWVRDNYGAVSELTMLSGATIELDTTAPVVTVDPLVTKDRTPGLTGSVDDPNAQVKVTVAGKTYDATNLANGKWFLADNLISPALADGLYDVKARATDTAGNVGTDQTTDELAIDYANPQLLSWGPVPDTGISSQDRVTKARQDGSVVLSFQFNEPVNGSAADITLISPDGTTVTPDSISGWGTAQLQVVLISPQQDGQYTVRLSKNITDVVGNPLNNGQDIQVSFVLDRQSPGVLDWNLHEAQPGTSDPVVTTDQTPILAFRFSEVVFGSQDDIAVIGPDGNTIRPEVDGLGTDTVIIQFTRPLTKAGLYRVILDASGTITDLAGNPLNGGTDVVIPFRLQLPISRMAGEFLVPSSNDLEQMLPTVAADGSGMFVTVWYSQSSSGRYDIYLRRFDATGRPLGDQQLVAGMLELPGVPNRPAIAVAHDGRFAVAWTIQNGLFTQVQMRIFNPDGSPASGIIPIGGQQYHTYLPDLAFDMVNGQVIVVYTRQDDGLVVPGDLYDSQIYLQRFNLDGTNAGAAVRITTTSGKAAQIGLDPAGRIIVVWNTKGLIDRSLKGRILQADGQLGSEFQIAAIDNLSDGLLATISLSVDDQGRFVVAWDEPFLEKVSVRLFDQDGMPITDPILLAGLGATEPSVDMDPAGNFIVAWSNADRDGDGSGIYARRFNTDGSAAAFDIRVNSQTLGDQSQPALAIGPWGRVFVCWSSLAPGMVGADIKGQILDYLPPEVSVDIITTDSASPGLSGQVDEPDAKVYVSVLGQTFEAINNADGTWTLAADQISLPAADGAYDVYVSATDPAGNTGSDTTTDELILDRFDPVLVGSPVIVENTGSTEDTLTGDTTPSVIFTFSEPVFGADDAIYAWITVEDEFGFTERMDAQIDKIEGWGTNQITVSFTTPLTIDGTYTIKLTAAEITDRAGKMVNRGQDIYATFKLDSQAPQVTVENITTTSPYPTLNGFIDDPTANIYLKIGNRAPVRIEADYLEQRWSYPVNQRLEPGQYDIVITATDAAGNIGTATGTLTIYMAAEDFDNDSNSWDDVVFFSRWEEVFEGDKDVPKKAPAGMTRSWGPDAAEVKLVQLSNIYSSSIDPLARKGTYLLFKLGHAWTDYKTSFSMMSEDDGDIGLMLRVKDANNYYRFSWHRATGQRRLVKCVDGQFTLLASDNAPMAKGTTYRIEIVALGSLLEVYVDKKLVFSLRDNALDGGTIAFYCHNNNRAYFDDLRVENLVGVNLPPRFTNLTASSNMIFDTQHVQLNAEAIDPDKDRPISYQWIIDEGQGFFDDPTSPNAIFTPADVTTPMLCRIHVEASDGVKKTKSDAIEIEVFDADAQFFLQDDFEDGDINGWLVKDLGKSKSSWKVKNGILTQVNDATGLLVYQKGSIWTEYQVDLDISSNADGVLGVVFRYQDENNYYRFTWNTKDGTRKLEGCVNGQVTTLASDKAKFVKKQVYKLTIIAFDRYLEVKVDGQRLFAVTDAALSKGTVGLYVSRNKSASFDNITVKNLKDADLPPVITAVTAANQVIRDGQPVNLQVEAYDPDGDHLTYQWIVEQGSGQFSDPSAANPDFVADDVTAPTWMRLNVAVSDGSNTVNQTLDLLVLDSDAPELLHEDFEDGQYDGWNIVDQGNRNGKGNWSAQSGMMVQSSGTYRRSDNLGRRGTFARYQIGSVWTDYEVRLDMGSTANGDIGLMFRVKDGNNYYRFALSGKDGYARLVRCKSGRFTTLGAKQVGYLPGQTYNVTVIVIANQIRVYIDGAEVFSVNDNSFGSGTIALYSYANPGAYFDNIQVISHTGHEYEPVVNSISATPARISDNRTSQLNVDVTEPDGQRLTYNWQITSGGGQLSSTTIANPVYIPPSVNQETPVTLCVDISDGIHIIRRTIELTVVSSPVLMQDSFEDGDYDGWTIVDQGNRLGPSVWLVDPDHQLVQTSGIYRASDNTGRRGTFAKYLAGETWTNYVVGLYMRSSTDGDIGLMFRVKDDSNYYRFAISGKDNTFRLVKCVKGRFTILASAPADFAKDQWYLVKVQAIDQQIKVFVDGAEVFSVTDRSIAGGTIALYAYANTGAYFDDVIATQVI